MFTRGEYARYFETIAEKEHAMVFALERFIPRISDVSLSLRLERILHEELSHARIADELIDRVMNPPSEARAQSRMHILGEATLTAPDLPEAPISCRVLDFSFGGLCIELPMQLATGSSFAVTAHFYESGTAMTARAGIRWCAQLGPKRYRAGLAFEEA